jgi:hypothetical protein
MGRVSNEEIAAVIGGTADRATEQRVTAAALLDSSVRERLKQLRTAETAPSLVAEIEDDGSFLLRAQRLKEKMQIVARQVAREHRESYTASSALEARAGPVFGGVPGLVRRTLDVLRQSVSLPCLAPASASSVGETRIRRDIFLSEGVRIELQQLPGDGTRLRVFADASGVAGGFVAQDADTIALELDGIGMLLIALNPEGRGFTDFQIGADEADIPAPRRAVALTGISLMRQSR